MNNKKIILNIRDGEPYWWNSPDIWVVPGNDPNGSPGQPIAGEPAFLWARVQNSGSISVSGVSVNFYWSNPATGVLRSNSVHVGSSFVDLDPQETQEVLCVIPWIPQVVNDGHECLVVEIIHPSDPLPEPISDIFDPPSYRQIAQKNITVLEMKENSMMILPIQVAAPKRQARNVLITTKVDDRLGEQQLIQEGLEGYKLADNVQLQVYFSLDYSCNSRRDREYEKIELSLKPNTAKPVFLKVKSELLRPNTYALLHVISHNGNKVDGGITYILTNKE